MSASRSLKWWLCLGLVASVAPLAGQDEKPARKKGETGNRPEWTVLFDGKSLDGWEQKNGTATYEVKDGAILGSTAAGSPNSFLCTTKDYGDFVLEFEVKLLRDDLNSGVQVRSHSKPEYRDGRVHGPQVEIESSPGQAGYIYGEASTGNWISPEAESKPHEHFKNGEWNKYRVRAVGDRIQTWINGEKVTDVRSEHTNPNAPGFIGLQVHSYDGEHPAQVMWRNIRIRELKRDAAE
ncbi:MAG TPA: DUF1080 domain-containing protein [Planctomycetaceae bacterium]